MYLKKEIKYKYYRSIKWPNIFNYYDILICIDIRAFLNAKIDIRV